MRRITLVKKVLADGNPCRKCREVEARLRKNGHDAWIDRVVIADERDPESLGWQLAREHDVATAPFFVVEESARTRVYSVYLKFVRETLLPENPGLTRPSGTLMPGRATDPA